MRFRFFFEVYFFTYFYDVYMRFLRGHGRLHGFKSKI